MTQTVYKVVDPTYGGLFSLYARGKYRTQYKPGEIVEKANIFVFCEQRDAESFRGKAYEVWEAETQSIPRPAPRCIPVYDHTRDHYYGGIYPDQADKLIKEFWEDPYGDGEGPLETLFPPTGSHLVNDIKLIRRVS